MTSGVSPARKRASEVLSRFFAAPVPLDLDAAARGLSEVDRGLFYEIVLGVLRHRAALDREIAPRLRGGIPSLGRGLREILEIALFQIRHLDRVPERAAVHEAVELARGESGESASRFVNAVLRGILRDGVRPARRDPESVLSSHPEFLVRRWTARLGRAVTSEIVASDDERDRFDVMANRLRGSREEIAARLRSEGLAVELIPETPAGLRVVSGNPLRSSAFAAGEISVADAGSQVLCDLLPAGKDLLDVAAAPGGKTLAARTGGRFERVFAVDRSVARLSRLVENVRRLRLTGVSIVAADARALPFPDGSFDRVLFDAPCSGTGTLRKHPDLRYRLTPRMIADAAEAQRVLLLGVASTVAPGGFLLYSTCSLEPEENESVVADLLSSDPRFERSPIEPPPAIAGFVTGARYQMVPRRGWDGFTAHLLRRRD